MPTPPPSFPYLKYHKTRVIEDAKRVCIARDKAKSELTAIKQQAEKDKAEFEVRIIRVVMLLVLCGRLTHQSTQPHNFTHNGTHHSANGRI